MIERVLYAITAAALMAVLAFDPTFAVNLARATGAEFTINSWEAGAAGVFLGLAVVALYREWRR